MQKKQIRWAEPQIGPEEVEAMKETVKSTWIGGNGPRVKEFEKKLTEVTGAKFALAVTNGTCALLCALQALRESLYSMDFLVPTLTFFATGATTYEIGRKLPTFIDCDRKTWNIKTDLEEFLEPKIIVPVDVGGLPVDYDGFKLRGSKFILADSAESIGSKYKGEPIGHQALIHTFSFHSAKVVSTGEGGAITTNNKELYEKMKSITNQGYMKKAWYEYWHENLGFNYRMSELHATLGLVQMGKMNRYVKERIGKARVYKDILGDKVEYQEIPNYAQTNYFLFTILVQKPIELCEGLKKEGIETKTMWIPLHLQPPFCRNSCSFPNAEYVSSHGVMLPIHNNMDEEDTKYVAETVKKLIEWQKILK